MAWSTTAAASSSNKGDDHHRPAAASRHHPLSYLPPDTEEYLGRSVASRLSEQPPHDSSSSLLQLVDQRVSVREFQKDVAVEDRVLDNALRVARLAPSAGNKQAYQVVIVRQVEQKRALAEAAAHQDWIADAPVVLVFLADEERSGEKYRDRGRYLYAIQDATIAAAYTQLALEAAGLASCWVGAFHEDHVADIVGASASAASQEVVSGSSSSSRRIMSSGILRPVVLMPVGVAAEHPKRHRRRAIRDFVHRGYVNSTHPAGATEDRKNRRTSSKRKTIDADPI